MTLGFARVFALALLLSACTALCAHAQVAKPSAPPSPDAPLPRVSVGAGLGFSFDAGGTGLGGAGAVSSTQASDGVSRVTPTGTALLEVVLTRRLRFMFGVGGGYSKRLKVKSVQEDTSPASSWSLGGGLGLRWIVNPGGVVEFSPALLLGAHGGRTRDAAGTVYERNGTSYHTSNDYAALGFDGRLGFVLERALLDRLYLRFEAYLLRGGVDRYASRVDGLTTRIERAGLGWGVAPSLSLRLSL